MPTHRDGPGAGVLGQRPVRGQPAPRIDPGPAPPVETYCPPVIANGKLFAPTYDGRVDVYGFVSVAPGPIPTNASPMHLVERLQREA
jgi:hypothetical protein